MGQTGVLRDKLLKIGHGNVCMLVTQRVLGEGQGGVSSPWPAPHLSRSMCGPLRAFRCGNTGQACLQARDSLPPVHNEEGAWGWGHWVGASPRTIGKGLRQVPACGVVGGGEGQRSLRPRGAELALLRALDFSVVTGAQPCLHGFCRCQGPKQALS